MSHTAVINHPNFGLYVWGAAVFNWIIAAISNNDAFLQGIAALVTAAAGVVSIYFAIRNRKR
jgi:hypothetical protein